MCKYPTECCMAHTEHSEDECHTPDMVESSRSPGCYTPEQLQAISEFCDEVNRRAEGNMLKTGKLEGAHFAAMTKYRKELGV